MKFLSRLLTSIILLLTTMAVVTGTCHGQIMSGKPAPAFSLESADGKIHDLSKMKGQPMVILYFFDVESRPSQEGLLSLDQLAGQYRDAHMNVWGITLSSKDKLADFISRTNPNFPVLLDQSGVSDLYQARFVLPTVYILGPELKILDYFQGGGKTTEIMLVKLAERELQRKQIVLARAISEHVEKKNPQNIQAKAVKGYAALKEGKLDEAAEVSRDISRNKGEGEVLGGELLATVYAKKGQVDEALEQIEQVEQKDPDRAYVNVIKGDILYSQDKKKEAQAEYEKAVQKKAAEPFQKALAFNQLGRVYATQGKYSKARELYDQAIDIDPYYVEAMSNKGVTHEKEGQWDKALGAYSKVLALDKNDTFAVVLAKKAEEMLSLQKDIAKNKRIDKLVKELAERYRTQKKSSSKTEDTWTSRPMVLSFVDFQEKGGLSERDGFSTVLTTQLADQMNASGRLQVVERVLLERLLEELNIGSSELADPETALKLGKVLAAKLIGTGSLYFLPDGTLLSLRLIDTETSALPKVVTRQFGSQASLGKEIHRLNRELLKSIMEKYPLQGYIVRITGDRVLINIGSKHGVVLGTKLDVVEEQEPIEYKGRMLSSSPKPVAEVKVVQVEPDLCYASIVKKERPLKNDDKVREKIEDITAIQ